MVNGYWPKTLSEALQIRNETSAVPYAGGTDLMMNPDPKQAFLFLGKLPELRKIESDGEWVHIGAAVTFSDALKNPLVPTLMKEAVSHIAAPAIRNAGTFGGNLGNGSAVADSVLIAYVADAKVKVVSVEGERLIDIDRFILDRKKLDLHKNELIAEILLPARGWENSFYQKVGGRSALAISYVSFAGLWEAPEGIIRKCRFAFGAVAPTILRFKDLEGLFEGKNVQEARTIRSDVLLQCEERLILPEQRVSADYGKTVCLNLLNAFFDEMGI